MKRIMALFLLMILVCSMLTIFCYAEDGEADELPNETETYKTDVDVNDLAQQVIDIITTDDENTTMAGRLMQWVEEHKGELLTVLGNAILCIVYYFVYKIQKSHNVKIVETATSILDKVRSTSSSNSKMVDTMNGMIEGYNAMEKLYEDNKANEEERSKLVNAVMIQNTAILEILREAYSQNKNLPQGVKDLINLAYASAKTTIESDDSLASVVAETKALLGGATKETVPDDKQD